MGQWKTGLFYEDSAGNKIYPEYPPPELKHAWKKFNPHCERKNLDTGRCSLGKRERCAFEKCLLCDCAMFQWQFRRLCFKKQAEAGRE